MVALYIFYESVYLEVIGKIGTNIVDCNEFIKKQ